MTSFASIADQIGRALLHSVWEGAVLAVLFAMALQLLRKRSAQSRYVAGCITLTLMVLAPIATVTLRPNARAIHYESAFASLPQPLSITKPEPSDGTVVLPGPALEHAKLSLPQDATIVWSLGLLIVSLWQIHGWITVRNLVRRSQPADAARLERLGQLRDRVGIRFSVAMHVCEHLATPALVGWLRPVILVPPTALCDLPVDYFEALLLHELAHIRRHDYLINLLQAAAETLLFYHPATWWVSAVIRQEREYCCDDETIRRTDSKVYVRALATMESFRADPVVHLALTASGGKLLRRIQRLTGTVPTRNRSNAGFLTVFALLTAIVVFSASYAADSTATSKPHPATQPTPAFTGPARGITPDDLVEPRFTSYRIQPGDRLSITMWDLQGPNTSTLRTTTVDEKGLVSLLILKEQVALSGLTESEAERAVAKAYHDAKLIEVPMVSVNVTEPHAQSFAIVGAVSHAGQFNIPDPRFHVLNAIALAGGTVGEVRRIIVQRTSPDGVTAAIDVPVFQLLNGDPSCNIAIHPYDTVVISTSGLPTISSVPATTAPSQPASRSREVSNLKDEDLRPTSRLVIGPNDLVQVALVYKDNNKKTVKQARVTESGKMSLPLLKNAMSVNDMTDVEFEAAIRKAYRDAAIDEFTDVSVTVIERRTNAVTVYGFVNRPGMYPIPLLETKLLECFPLAQGFSDSHPLRIEIDRTYPTGSTPRTLKINAADIVADDLHSNIYVKPGDQIRVLLAQ